MGACTRAEEAPAHADVKKNHEADPKQLDTGRSVDPATDVATELGEHMNDLGQ